MKGDLLMLAIPLDALLLHMSVVANDHVVERPASACAAVDLLHEWRPWTTKRAVLRVSRQEI